MQGIGLLGLLVVVALVFYLMFAAGGKGSAGTALEAKKTMETQTYSAVGRDAEGESVSKSIQFDTDNKGIVVKDVTAGGAMDTKYGLKAGDVILEVGPLIVKEQAGDAKGMLELAYARSETLVVLRGTQRIKLPDDRNVVAVPTPAPAQPQAQTPPPAEPQPAAQPPQQRMTPRRQIEGILNGRRDEVPTH
ncbi:MAG: PDZ domain-containing protein [Tepidisphaeraceae bacterium]